MTATNDTQQPSRTFRRLALNRSFLLALAVIPCLPGFADAHDAEIAKALKVKGVEVRESNGTVTATTVPDASKLTDDEFRQITRLSHLTMLSLTNGFNDQRLAQLAALADLEYLQTNLAQVTDEGIKPLAKLKNLKTLKFFHPGKSFSGTGLFHLAKLRNLQSLTIAGSLAFNDDGLAAVARLTALKEFRTWHASGTDEGVKKLKGLTNLTTLDFDSANITQVGAEHLRRLTNLTRLDLGRLR